jgi:hypothetical protein
MGADQIRNSAHDLKVAIPKSGNWPDTEATQCSVDAAVLQRDRDTDVSADWKGFGFRFGYSSRNQSGVWNELRETAFDDVEAVSVSERDHLAKGNLRTLVFDIEMLDDPVLPLEFRYERDIETEKLSQRMKRAVDALGSDLLATGADIDFDSRIHKFPLFQPRVDEGPSIGKPSQPLARPKVTMIYLIVAQTHRVGSFAVVYEQESRGVVKRFILRR